MSRIASAVGGKNMKKMSKYSGILTLCLLCMGIAVSCKKNEIKTTEPTAVTTENETTKEPEATETPADTPEQTETEKAPETAKAAATVSIYSMNDETLELETANAEVPEGQKIDSEFIVKEVVKSFADRGVEIGIYGISEREDGICVSFTKEKAPAAGVGTTVEAAILDSIAQSLLDNLDACEKVYYMIEDGPYESGHMIFEENEPYTWK